jgi:sugar lactone lactonase YvrE
VVELMGGIVESAPEQVTDALAYHAEGPVWWEGWGGLRWVDMLAGDVLSLRPDGAVERMHVGDVAAFIRPRTNGGWVVGTERGLARADGVDALPTPWLTLWEDDGLRMNEGGCDPQGRLYCGSMAYDRTPGAARLYRVHGAGRVETVLPDVTISNGIDFSPDDSRAYYNDTSTGATDVFDVVDGELTDRRAFHHAEGENPDGLTVDSAGNVWVAINGAGRVRCYSPDAAVLAEVELPAHQVTACTLGGPDLRDLFVTTSREDLDDPEPEAGAVFRVRVTVPGKPVLPFAG